jgi:hypothetical protein
VHAIVGALASGISLQIAETVAGPNEILMISPASTSPGLTAANDDDFLFRSTISDAAQGIVLSQLATEDAVGSVCTMYLNTPYGQGLSNAFTAAYEEAGGTVTAEVPHEQNQTTYATELAQCEGADTMAAIAYPQSATTFLREAAEGDMFENYLFVDGTKEPAMFTDIGYANFDGERGTAPAALPTQSATDFADRYTEAFGELPPKPFIKEAYDATYLIALAAEQADSVDGAAMRDALRDVSNDPGEEINPGPDGWEAALAAIDAGDEVNYEGAGQLEMDESGDPLVGAIEYWHGLPGRPDHIGDHRHHRRDAVATLTEHETGRPQTASPFSFLSGRRRRGSWRWFTAQAAYAPLHPQRNAPLLREQPLRPQQKHTDDQQAQDQLPEVGHPRLDSVPQVVALELEADRPEAPENVSPGDGALVVAAAADNQHRPEKERSEKVRE